MNSSNDVLMISDPLLLPFALELLRRLVAMLMGMVQTGMLETY
jgi:hypothetical protein